jgi:hypothetical protein
VYLVQLGRMVWLLCLALRLWGGMVQMLSGLLLWQLYSVSCMLTISPVRRGGWIRFMGAQFVVHVAPMRCIAW